MKLVTTFLGGAAAGVIATLVALIGLMLWLEDEDIDVDVNYGAAADGCCGQCQGSCANT